jgi:hypothetical protein
VLSLSQARIPEWHAACVALTEHRVMPTLVTYGKVPIRAIWSKANQGLTESGRMLL